MNLNELATRYATGHRNFGVLNLDEANLRNINLSGANLAGSSLNGVNLSGANLSEAQLDGVKLNVARLNATNFYKASLNEAKLNVANLIRANLRLAEMQEAMILHAELVRADLTGANLQRSNCQGTDFREANLRRTNFSGCNLSHANLRDVLLAESSLEQADLAQADLAHAQLQQCNLKAANLSHANLTRTQLQGADLRGANLQTADLSGADLRDADLRGAQLSGAVLVGANLVGANLTDTQLVHADLTRARLAQVNWLGANLTGAILTGAWLHPVVRCRLHTADLICAWLDVSELGDGSVIQELQPSAVETFFGATRPTVQVTIDAPLTWDAQFALATLYHQLHQVYPGIQQPPSIQVRSRRTYLTFDADRDGELFAVADCALWPFTAGTLAAPQWQHLFHTLLATTAPPLTATELAVVQDWQTELMAVCDRLSSLRPDLVPSLAQAADAFLNAPMTVTLSDSRDRVLEIFHHPHFGKPPSDTPTEPEPLAVVAMATVVQFLQDPTPLTPTVLSCN